MELIDGRHLGAMACLGGELVVMDWKRREKEVRSGNPSTSSREAELAALGKLERATYRRCIPSVRLFPSCTCGLSAAAAEKQQQQSGGTTAQDRTDRLRDRRTAIDCGYGTWHERREH